MRVTSLHHVPFEGLGSLEALIRKSGCSLNRLEMWKAPPLPSIGDFDILVVMGGPMAVSDVDSCPWIIQEKALIRNAIDAGRSILGICLGAQLVAEALGAQVTPGQYREIGWHPLNRDSAVAKHPLGQGFPRTFVPFHWHGDTFSIPEGALPLGASEACENQGFIYGETVLALQFHLETTRDSAADLIRNSEEELARGGLYVQSSEQMLNQPEKFRNIAGIMDSIWQTLLKTTASSRSMDYN